MTSHGHEHCTSQDLSDEESALCTARLFWGSECLRRPFRLTVIKFGLQAVYGGQAIGLMLGAMIPQYKNMPNTLPAR
jgi:hypothetical protein